VDKNVVLSKIEKSGIVPVIRAEGKSQAINITEAVKGGGIKVIEITMTVPGAISVIKELSEKYRDDPEITIGAGSILDGETARNAILAEQNL